MKVSVIMPFVNEWPQIAFTIRAVREQLEGYCDYEIIAIDNYCPEVMKQGQKPDRGHDHYVLNKERISIYSSKEKLVNAKFQVGHIMAQSTANDWLKCYKMEDRLSHWNAKNLGVSESTGDILIFLDAHVIPSQDLIPKTLDCFCEMFYDNGHMITMHMPLSYHILENKQLMYKLVYEPEKGVVHYSFTGHVNTGMDRMIEVPCMSTCGMVMKRSLFDKIGGWPEGLGIYGGGENYINFLCAILGVRKFIPNTGCLHHHGDRRNYSWNWFDYHRNRMIATGIYGGMKMLEKYEQSLGSNDTTQDMMRQAIECVDSHCQKIGLRQDVHISGPVIDINEWAKEWEGCRAIGYNTGRHYV